MRTTIHATTEYGTPSICGAVRESDEINSTTDHTEVTCKRCLAQLAKLGSVVAPLVPADVQEAPEPIKTATKQSKQPKPANLHLSDLANERTGTLCNIPGKLAVRPEEVTCKVCLAKMNGTKPTNAIPEYVKAARKSFRSFVARVTYMVYMDADTSLSGSWTMKHTNIAGTQYEVSSYGIYEDGKSLGFGPGKDIKQWMEEHWSCGEEK